MLFLGSITVNRCPTSSNLIVDTGVPQGCVLSPLLLALHPRLQTAAEAVNINTLIYVINVTKINANNVEQLTYLRKLTAETKWPLAAVVTR